ncbi:MAG: IS110 family transposase [Pirellulales bacterium]|jgi:transposase|nr:IS110 family transposase [Pirellulales bacterium]|tara:strand:- start:317 stop:1420 length:1104 start_codon:yes stop_codon:yes gene_type:complete
MNKSKVLYVGMDVDKEKIAMAALEGSSNEFVGEQLVRNDPAAVAKYFKRFMKSETEVIACYEAGCFGFRLARQLSDIGIGCAVAAPGMLPKMPSDRVKTDRRDARTLAKALRNGDVHNVYVPTEQDEAVRDYLRMFEDMKGNVKRAKQRVLTLLLRKGIRYTESGNWTAGHWRWLRTLELDQPLTHATLQEYLTSLGELEESCQRIAARIEEIALEERYAEPVARLKAFKGIATLIALSFIIEIGDFRRFATAQQFMAFLGLVPSEHSSGSHRRQGSITKAGNSHLRKLVVEAGWHYRSYHPVSKRLAKRREGLPPQLVAYAHRAGRRLNKKYLHLVFSGKPTQVAATAVARELSGFIWGTMTGKTA